MDEDEDVVLIMMMYMPEIESCKKRSTYNETHGQHPALPIPTNLFVLDHAIVPRIERGGGEPIDTKMCPNHVLWTMNYVNVLDSFLAHVRHARQALIKLLVDHLTSS